MLRFPAQLPHHARFGTAQLSPCCKAAEPWLQDSWPLAAKQLTIHRVHHPRGRIRELIGEPLGSGALFSNELVIREGGLDAGQHQRLALFVCFGDEVRVACGEQQSRRRA